MELFPCMCKRALIPLEARALPCQHRCSLHQTKTKRRDHEDIHQPPLNSVLDVLLHQMLTNSIAGEILDVLRHETLRNP